MTAPFCATCGGKGWLIVAVDGNQKTRGIERCDACIRFPDDDAAYRAVAPLARDAHCLIPPTLEITIPLLYSQEEEIARGLDPIVHAKFFTPDSTWTWYVTEYSAVAPDGCTRLCFGLVDGWDIELGFFSLDELETARGPLGLQIERDIHWKPRPLSQMRKALNLS